MIGRDRISFKQWFTVKLWAEKNGYTFANNGAENGRVNIGANLAINYPVTAIGIADIIVWCNAYSEYYGKIPYYRERDNNTMVIKDANSMNGGFQFSVLDNGGYRLPSREEYCFAMFDGDAGLRSYNYDDTYGENLGFSNKRISRVQPEPYNRRGVVKVGNPISLFTPNGVLGLVGLYDCSNEFVESWGSEKKDRYTYYKYLYYRHSEKNTDGFRIACSVIQNNRAISESVTARYAEQKKNW
jgi:hypothetical protein